MKKNVLIILNLDLSFPYFPTTRGDPKAAEADRSEKEAFQTSPFETSFFETSFVATIRKILGSQRRD